MFLHCSYFTVVPMNNIWKTSQDKPGFSFGLQPKEILMRIIQFLLNLKAFQYSWWYWKWWQVNDAGSNFSLRFALCLKENCCIQLIIHSFWSIMEIESKEKFAVRVENQKHKHILRMTQNYRMVEFGRDLWRSFCPASLFKQDLLGLVAQGQVQEVFEYL